MNDFLLTEYQTCISERKDLIHQTNSIERNSLIALGLVWTWLFSHDTIEVNIATIAWFVPAFIVLMSIIRVWSLNTLIENNESYLQQIEKKHFEEEGLFNFHKTNRKGNKWKSWLGISAYLFWSIMSLVSIGYPIYRICAN